MDSGEERWKHGEEYVVPYNGEIWRVLYLANEPFERNWGILIWRLRRCYYNTDVAVHRKSLIWRFFI